MTNSVDQPILEANNFQHGAPNDARPDPMESTLRDLSVNSKKNKAGVKQGLQINVQNQCIKIGKASEGTAKTGLE